MGTNGNRRFRAEYNRGFEMTTVMAPMKIQVQDSEAQWDDLPIGQVFSCEEHKHYCVRIKEDYYSVLPFDGEVIHAYYNYPSNIKPVQSRLIIG